MRVGRALFWVLLGGAVGYGLLWAVMALVILAMSEAARGPVHQGVGPDAVPGVHKFARVDSHLWRGAAPSADGYRRLASLGVKTVIDLRAEHLAKATLDVPKQAGLAVVRLPVRDGQAPPPEQVTRFLTIVQTTPGPIFVHCGAGVGRTGSMAAAYLVHNGQANAATAIKRSLAIGPPTLEQLAFMRRLDGGRIARPPTMLVALSRIADSPRRSWSRLRG